MPNFNLYTPLPFREGKLVSATQVLPGNFAATHHITTAVVNMPPGTVLGRGPAWPGGPVTDYVPVAAKEGVNVDNTGDAAVVEDEDDGGGFGAYIPGAGARVARPGQARVIRGDRFHYVRWNLHYQATGQPEVARPRIGVWWENGNATTVERSLSLREQTSENHPVIADPAKPRNVGIASNVNPFLAPIPPNDGNWTLTGVNGFQDDATIQAITLHMHLRGKDVTYVQLAVPVRVRGTDQGSRRQHDQGDCALRQLTVESSEPRAGEGSLLVRTELGRHVSEQRAVHRRQGPEEASGDRAGSALRCSSANAQVRLQPDTMC
jgi:hypothetical protein